MLLKNKKNGSVAVGNNFFKPKGEGGGGEH